MKAPNRPSLSDRRPPSQLGHCRGSPPSALTGKMCGPRSSSSALITSPMRSSLISATALAKADGGDPRQCPSCEGGRLSLKLGRFGAFIGCSNYPECRYTRALSAPEGGAEGGTKRLGLDPASGLEVTL